MSMFYQEMKNFNYLVKIGFNLTPYRNSNLVIYK